MPRTRGRKWEGEEAMELSVMKRGGRILIIRYRERKEGEGVCERIARLTLYDSEGLKYLK